MFSQQYSKSVDEQRPSCRLYYHAAGVLLFLLACRLVAMYLVPLNDKPEARYGEIARIMLETGNWVTPMHYYGEPFWAKPPLSTWLSALSMKLFGVNELAARLPSLLLSVGVLSMIWNVARKRSGPVVALLATVVLAGSLFFFEDAGRVMTDPSLLFSTTLIIVAFWQAIVHHSRLWGYLFFVGLGLGLLAKGPVALALTGLPLLIWVWRQKQWGALWQRLPWATGALLTLAMAVPWYVLAELRTPGFLNYFIVGEHISRFLEPGWTGDKYGDAHVAPYGMIWLYALIGTAPWSIAGLVWLARHAKAVPALCKDDDGWVGYLLFCTIVPLLFFTFAGNVIYTYVYPSLPTFALLFAELARRARLTPRAQARLVYCATLSGFVFLFLTAAFVYRPERVARSQNRVVTVYRTQSRSADSNLVYWAHKIDYSAKFYSSGKARATLDAGALGQLLSNRAENYVVVNSAESTPLPPDIRAHLTEVATVKILKNRYTLFRSDSFTEYQARSATAEPSGNGPDRPTARSEP
jgi:4-amino-4-deoxy-L-arabinose transferase-like glycosyltransferase